MAFENDNEMIESTNFQDINNDLGVDTINKVQSIDTINKVDSGKAKPYTYKTRTYASAQVEDEAKNKAELDIATGVEHVLDDKETSDYVSTKELYEKTLGVTEYDELRAKLNLRDDESFTDYYNRTHYVPKGFEMQAKLLLAEEKRKKLYADVEAGKMSEEDFLYEAYGKDLLKEDGIDFESPLYWYQEFKKGNYDDPRDNSTYMLRLIDNARTLFQQEKWYEEKSKARLEEALAGYVTGEVLPAASVEEIFKEQFEELSKYYDDKAKIVKYYRAGMLQGFDPTIDTDGDGKIDYYYSPDGKLYNVNETGQGANTMKAYYNDDGSLNRIVMSDSAAGEVLGEFGKGIGRFFTDVIDLFALAGGAIVDIFDGDGFGSTVAEVSATMNQFWNSTILGDVDYIADSGLKDNDGDFNTTVALRGASRFIGTITANIVTAVATGGASLGAKTFQTAVTEGGKTVMKTTAKSVAKGIAKTPLIIASQMTRLSNGVPISSGFGATAKALIAPAIKDTLQSIATLSVNQERLQLSDSDIVVRSMGGAAINFAAGIAFRSVAGDGAVKRWAKVFNKNTSAASLVKAADTIKVNAPTFYDRILTNTMFKGEKILYTLGNTVMDGVENVIAATTQTSLANKGKVWDWESCGQLFNNPQFLASMIYQSVDNIRDSTVLKKEHILAAVTDVNEYDMWVRNYFQNGIDNAKDPQAAMNISNARDLYNKDIQDNIANGASRAEATLKAIEKMVVGLDIPEGDEFYKPFRDKMMSEIKMRNLAITEATFQTINEHRQAYVKYTKNLLTKIGGDIIVGKAARDVNKLLSTYTMQTYINKGMFPDMERQIIADAMSKQHLMKSIMDKLPETDFSNEIDVVGVFGDMVKDNDGIYDTGLIKDLSKEADAKLKEEIAKVPNELKHTIERNVIIRVKNTGSSTDGTDSHIEKISYIKLAYELFDSIAQGGTDDTSGKVLIKLDDQTYMLRFVGFGDTAVNAVTVRNIIGSIANIRTLVTNGENISPESVAQAFKTLYSNFYESLDEADNALVENIGKIPEAVAKMLEEKLISKRQAAMMITKLESYYDTLNAKDDKGNKLRMPSVSNEGTPKAYQDVYNLKQFMSEYSEVSESLRKISEDDTKQVSKTDREKVVNFLDKHYKTDGKEKNYSNTIVKMAVDEGIVPGPIDTMLKKLAFQLGQGDMLGQISQSTREELLNLLSSVDEINSLDKDYAEAFVDTLLKDVNLDPKEFEFVRGAGSNTQLLKMRDVFTFQDFGRYLSDLKASAPKKDMASLLQAMDIDEYNKFVEEFGTYDTDVKVKYSGLKDSLKPLYKEYLRQSVLGMLEALGKTEADFAASIANVKGANLDMIFSDETIGREFKINLDEFQDKVLDYVYNNNYKTTILNLFDKATDEYLSKIYIKDKQGNRVTHIVPMKASHTVRINLREVEGARMRELAKKLANPTFSSTIQLKDSTNKIARQLFSNNYGTALTELKSEKAAIDYLIAANRGNPILTMTIDDAAFVDLLQDLHYNKNAIIEYSNDGEILPGIYYENRDTKGLQITDTPLKTSNFKALLEKRANALDDQFKKIVTNLKDDPITKLETLTSGITFVTNDTELDPKQIMYTWVSPEEIDFSIEHGKNILQMFAKLKKGKLGGMSYDYILSAYSGAVVSGKVNDDLKKAAFVSKVIDSVSSYIKDNNLQPLTITQAEYNLHVDDTLQKFWDILPQEDGTYHVKPKLSSDEFKQEALKLISEKGLTNLNYILPVFENFGNDTRINVVAPLGQGDVALASAPTMVDKFLQDNRNLFSATDIMNMLTEQRIIMPTDLSDDAATKAKNYFKKKSIQQIMDAAEQDNLANNSNVFIRMMYSGVLAAKHLSDVTVQTLIKDYNISETEALTIMGALGTFDNRQNIGLSIKNVIEASDFDDVGELKVTEDLANRILEELKFNRSNSGVKAEIDSQKDSPSISGYQTDSLGVLSDLSNITTTDIMNILNFLDLTSQKFVTIEGHNIANKLLAAVQEDDKGNLFISMKTLFSFSADEKKELNKLINSIDHNDKQLISITGTALKDYSSLKELVRLVDAFSESEITKSTDPLGPNTRIEVGTGSEPTTENVPGAITQNKIPSDYFMDFIASRGRSKSKPLYLKLSETIDNPQYKQNVLLKAITEMAGLVTPTVNNKGSLVVQNYMLSENIVMFKTNIINMAYSLQDYMEKTFKQKLSTQAAMEVAYNYFKYSNGMQTQNIHPEYIFFDADTGRLIMDGTEVKLGMSSPNTDASASTLHTIFKDFFDPETLRLKTNPDGKTPNILMLKLDRNALTTTYAEATNPIKMYSMKEDEGYILQMLRDRILKVRTDKAIESGDMEEATRALSAYFFRSELRNPLQSVKDLREVLTPLGDESSVESIIKDYLDLNVASSDRTQSEEILDNTILEYESGEEVVQTTTTKKTNRRVKNLTDMTKFGYTYDSLMNRKDVQDSLAEVDSYISSQINTRKNRPLLEDFIDDILVENTDDAKYKLEQLKANYKKEFKNEGLKKLKADVCLAYMRHNSSPDAIILKLATSNPAEIQQLRNTFKDSGKSLIQTYNLSAGVTSEGLVKTIPEIIEAPKLCIDSEYLYDPKNPKNDKLYQLSFTLEIPGESPRTFTQYYNHGIKLEDIAKESSGYFECYTKYLKDTGARGAYQESLGPNSRVIDNNNPDYFIPDLASKLGVDKLPEGLIVIGYNSQNFDIPKMQKLNCIDANLFTTTLDAYHMAKTLPLTQTIDMFGNKLKLVELAKQLLKDDPDFNIDNATAHSADIDTITTLKVFNKMLTMVAEGNDYQYKILDTLTDLSNMVEHNNKLTWKNKTTGEPLLKWQKDNTISSKFGLNSKDTLLGAYTDINRLAKTRALMNELAYQLTQNRTDVNDKYFRQQLHKARNESQLRFAQAFNRVESRQEVLEVFHYLLDSNKYIGLENNKIIISEANKPLVQQLLQKAAYAVSDKIGMNNILEGLAKNKHNLKDLEKLGIDAEDFKTWKQKHSGDNHSSIVRDTITNVFGEDILNTSAQGDVAYKIVQASKPIIDYINKTKDLDDDTKQFISRALERFYDVDESYIERGEYPTAKINEFLDMTSNLSNDFKEWLMTDPVISTTYKSIYELATSSFNNTVTINGKKEYADVNTIYVTQKRFNDLMGSSSDISIESVKKSLGIEDYQELYLPVTRHPKDKLDSDHYFKIKIMDDTPNDNGLYINIDTLKTRLNGDLDGDKLMIFRPTKATNDFCYELNETKYLAESLLNNTLNQLRKSKALNYNVYDDFSEKRGITFGHYKLIEHDIINDAEVKALLENHLSQLNARDGVDKIALYSQLKEEFLSKKFVQTLTEKLKAEIKDPDISRKLVLKVLEANYIKAGVDVGQNLSGVNRFQFATDCESMLRNTHNINAKRAITVSQYMNAHIQGDIDIVTGNYQKALLTGDYSNISHLRFIDNALRLSNSTESLIDANLDIVKQTLYNNLNDYNKKGIQNISTVQTLILNAKDSNDILNALNVFELYINKNSQDKIQTAIKNLKNNSSDDPFVKAYKSFTSDDFHTTLENILAFKKDTRGLHFGTNADSSFLEFVKHKVGKDRMHFIKWNDQDAIDRINNDETSLAKVMPVVYFVDRNIPGLEQKADVLGALPGLKKYKGRELKYVNNLSDTTLKYFKKKYSKAEKLTPSDMKMLNLSTDTPCAVEYRGIYNNEIVLSYVFDIAKQKMSIIGDGSAKGTFSKYTPDMSGYTDEFKNILNNCAIARSIDERSAKKMTHMKQDGSDQIYKCYDAQGNLLGEINGNQPYPVGTQAIITDEAIHLAESMATFDKNYKLSSFEQLSRANNLFSSGGVASTLGVFFKWNEEQGDFVFDNTEYRRTQHILQRMSAPDRLEHNALDLYQALQLIVLVKNSDIPNKKDFISNTLSSHKAGMDLESEINKLKKQVDTKAIKNSFEQAILSKELYNKVYNIQKTSVNPEGLSLKSKGSATEIIHKYSDTVTNMEGSGDIYDMDYHVDQSIDNGYISTKDLINYLSKVAGAPYLLSNKICRDAEKYNLLLNGTFKSGLKVDPNYISNQDPKITQQIPNIIVQHYGPSIASAESEADFLTRYDNIDKLVDVTNKKTASKIKTSALDSTSSHMAIALRALTESDSVNTKDMYGVAQDLSPEYQKVKFNVSYPDYKFDKSQGMYLSSRNTSNILDAEELELKDVPKALSKLKSSPLYFDKMSKRYKEETTNGVSIYKGLIDSAGSDPNAIKQRQDLSVEESMRIIATELDGLNKKQREDNALIKSKYKVLENYKPELHSTPSDQMDQVVNRYSSKFAAGDVSGEHKQFKTKKLSLNFGLEMKDDLDLRMDRNIKQTIIDDENAAQYYATEIMMLSKMVEQENILDDINNYAYVLSLKNRIDVAVAELRKAEVSKNDKQASNLRQVIQDLTATFKELKIADDMNTYIKNFEKHHSTAATQLQLILKRLHNDASKYCQLTGEPGQNIFFALTGSEKNSIKARRAGAKYVISDITRGGKLYNSRSKNDEAVDTQIPAYAGYNLFSALQNTTYSVANHIALYNNAMRLKQDKVIDSTNIHRMIEESITSPEMLDRIKKIDINTEGKNKLTIDKLTREQITNIELILNNIYSIGDNALSTEVTMVLDRLQPGDNKPRETTIGQAYLDIYTALKKYIDNNSNYSLSEAIIQEASATNEVDKRQMRNIIYAHEQVSDLFAHISGLTGDSLVSNLYNKITAFAKQNNLELVDRFGRTLSRDFIYKLDDSSLEYVSKYSRLYQDYEKGIVDEAMQGDLYFMDKELAKAFADNVFVKTEATKFQKILQKTSGWCVKMLMSSPFKFVDRFIKFTMYDAATLSTANHNTLFKQSEAYSDLKQFFASKGAVASDNMKEFMYTQGYNSSKDTFDLLSGGSGDIDSFKLFNNYTKKVGDAFNFQTLSQRYAYWLATKEALQKGDYSVLGSAYHLKEQIKGLNDILNSDGKISVTREGQQAAFAMAQLLGAPNDFPTLSKTLNRYGMVFTTFPLASLRWGIGELRSAGAALKDLFTEGVKSDGAKWLARNSGGIIGTFILEQMLINVIASMFNVDEEKEEEWKESGAIPNLTQTLIQGQPIMDTFSSMNPTRELYGLTLEPFFKKEDGDEDSLSGVERFLYKNILSHVNPIAKSGYEILAKTDLIDDQVIDTSEKYSMLENLFRKTSAYVLGSAGANAMTKTLFQSADSDVPTNVIAGFKNAINAELGNTKTYKANQRNYYKVRNLINSYLYKDTPESNIPYANTEYNTLKAVFKQLMESNSKPSEVYKTIEELIAKGYSMTSIRSALKNSSLIGKMENIENYSDLISVLSPAELQNLKTALAYEEFMYPWLDNTLDELSSEITRSNAKESSKYRSSLRYGSNSYYYTKTSKPTYNTYNQDYNTNYNTYKKDPFETYSEMIKQQEYQQQQAEYARKRKQWEDN